MKKILSAFIMVLTIITTFNANAQEENNIIKNSKNLVVYFSATGTTAGVAKKLSKAINADLFEIKPEQPYTEADLDWHDKNSRSSVEMKNQSSRPIIAEKIENIDQYKVIFVGFPIWWHREPSIVDTFMESYEFNGQTIIPFATSGSSDIGSSGDNMQELAPNAKVYEGKRFPKDVSEEDLKTWAEEWL